MSLGPIPCLSMLHAENWAILKGLGTRLFRHSVLHAEKWVIIKGPWDKAIPSSLAVQCPLDSYVLNTECMSSFLLLLTIDH